MHPSRVHSGVVREMEVVHGHAANGCTLRTDRPRILVEEGYNINKTHKERGDEARLTNRISQGMLMASTGCQGSR